MPCSPESCIEPLDRPDLTLADHAFAHARPYFAHARRAKYAKYAKYERPMARTLIVGEGELPLMLAWSRLGVASIPRFGRRHPCFGVVPGRVPSPKHEIHGIHEAHGRLGGRAPPVGRVDPLADWASVPGRIRPGRPVAGRIRFGQALTRRADRSPQSRILQPGRIGESLSEWAPSPDRDGLRIGGRSRLLQRGGCRRAPRRPRIGRRRPYSTVFSIRISCGVCGVWG
jgi:hypothetical protein